MFRKYFGTRLGQCKLMNPSHISLQMKLPIVFLKWHPFTMSLISGGALFAVPDFVVYSHFDIITLPSRQLQ